MKKQDLIENYNLNLDFEESDNNFNGLYDLIVDYTIATPEEIALVININRQSTETLLDIVYARTGLRSLEQLLSDLGQD